MLPAGGGCGLYAGGGERRAPTRAGVPTWYAGGEEGGLRRGMPEGKKEACGGGGRGGRERESPARARGGGGRWGWAPAEKRPRGNVRAQGSADDRVVRVDAEEACGRQASCKGGADVFPIRSAEEACGGARAYGGCEAGAKRNGHRRGVPTTRATPSIMIAGVRARLRARWHAWAIYEHCRLAYHADAWYACIAIQTTIGRWRTTTWGPITSVDRRADLACMDGGSGGRVRADSGVETSGVGRA